MCLQKATELAQAVANSLFALPPSEDRDGPIVHLPPPTIRLPREKHVRISCFINSCDLICVAVNHPLMMICCRISHIVSACNFLNLVPKL